MTPSSRPQRFWTRSRVFRVVEFDFVPGCAGCSMGCSGMRGLSGTPDVASDARDVVSTRCAGCRLGCTGCALHRLRCPPPLFVLSGATSRVAAHRAPARCRLLHIYCASTASVRSRPSSARPVGVRCRARAGGAAAGGQHSCVYKTTRQERPQAPPRARRLSLANEH